MSAAAIINFAIMKENVVLQLLRTDRDFAKFRILQQVCEIRDVTKSRAKCKITSVRIGDIKTGTLF